MNFVGHVQVALGVSDHDLVLLGAILPDVESLLGAVVPDAREDPDIGLGIAIHHRTDALFHADPRFRAGSIALTRALQGRGVGRGASRGVGHAGWELLLDGVLATDGRVTEAFAGAAQALARVASRAGAPEADRLARFAAAQRDTPIWDGYADPSAVALRLHRQLQGRPRLAFPAEHLDRVVRELTAAHAEVQLLGPGLAADIAAAVAAEAPGT
ncbi:MAG: hypothetical protein Q8K58_04985 [Acidimicrobiales bacterium]|nr:hypothetical protein [Acidimicrobiales bacterium]